MAVTGQIGDADVRLDNAAEEATMQKILDTLRDMNSMGSGGGGAGVGGAGAVNMGKLGKSVTFATSTMKGLGVATGLAAGALSGLASMGSGAVKLGAGFIAAQPKITDFSKALGDLPLGLSVFGEAIHAVVELLYKNYTTFQQLSASGIAFGDKLEYMNGMAARLGIGLDTLAGSVAGNSERLAFLGTATRGAEMAIKDAGIAFDQNRDSLQRFGLSFEEQNETFMRFFAQNSMALQRETMTRSQLIDMSDDYAKGIRRLSELTGTQADAIQDEVDKANANKSFAVFMSGLEGQEKARAESVMRTFGQFGDSGREAAMSMIMGVAPLTEGAAQMMTINKGFSDTLRQSVSSSRNFNGSLESFEKGLLNNVTAFANSQKGFVQSNARFGAAITMAGDGLGPTFGDLLMGIQKFTGSAEDLESDMGKTSPLAQAFNNLNSMLQTLREQLADSFVKLLTSEKFQSGMTSFTNFISEVTDDIAKEGFFGYMKRIFGDLMLYMKMAVNDTFIGGMFVDNDPLKQEIEKKYSKIAGDSQALIEAQNKATFPVEKKVLGSMIAPLLSANRKDVTDAGNKKYLEMSGILNEMYNGGYLDKDQYKNFQVRSDTAKSLTDDDLWGELPPGITDIASLTAHLNKANRLGNILGIHRGGFDFSQFTDSANPLNDPKFIQYMGQEFGLQLRNMGTLGATGKFFEPRDTLAMIHKGERVLNPQEAQQSVTQTSGSSNLVNKLVDSNREGSVKLLDALNMLTRKMDTQNNLTKQVIATVEQYS